MQTFNISSVIYNKKLNIEIKKNLYIIKLVLFVINFTLSYYLLQNNSLEIIVKLNFEKVKIAKEISNYISIYFNILLNYYFI